MVNNPVINNVRRNLKRNPGDPVPQRPQVVSPRLPGSQEDEIDLLLKEINLLSGNAKRIHQETLRQTLAELVEAEEISKAILWDTPGLSALNVRKILIDLGVTIIPNDASMIDQAESDLGITEIDYALPETGTLALLADSNKPRSVSLLPRVHLAICQASALRPDITQVLEESKDQGYLVFITGPSRTADIELTVALGVHGPKSLYAWMIEP